MRGVVSGAVTILLLINLLFVLVRLVGDPVASLVPDSATPAEVAAIEARLGLDESVPRQYVTFLGDVASGDFGDSYRSGRPAMDLVLERVPATFQLAGVAFLLAVVVAVPLGVLSAVKPGSVIDVCSRFLAVLGQSLPIFWLAILLILLFGVRLGWLPTGGRGGLESLVLPGVALSMSTIPLTMRLTRSAMLEELDKDYITTAVSKGLNSTVVVLRHALRNALMPIVTILGLRIGALVSGAIVVEEVFSYPGLGRLGIAALLNRDYPVIMAFVVFVAVVTVVVNLLVDISYTLINPRLRVGG